MTRKEKLDEFEYESVYGTAESPPEEILTKLRKIPEIQIMGVIRGINWGTSRLPYLRKGLCNMEAEVTLMCCTPPSNMYYDIINRFNLSEKDIDRWGHTIEIRATKELDKSLNLFQSLYNRIGINSPLELSTLQWRNDERIPTNLIYLETFGEIPVEERLDFGFIQRTKGHFVRPTLLRYG